MKKAYLAILTGAMAVATLSVATPAMAQGQNSTAIKKDGFCPSGWSETGKAAGPSGKYTQCEPAPNLRSVPKVYYNPSGQPCSAGYRADGKYCTDKPAGDGVSAADKLVSYGTVTKANKLDRCPLGYFSKSDMTICTTRLSPAPQSRNKKGACNSNEIDEWGLYCTANANSITREQAEEEATRDFNAIYSANGANYPAQGSDTEDYPSMVKAYGPKGGAKPASSSSGGQASNSSGTQPAQCTTDSGNGSAQGAAVGGAVAGQAGAAIGSVIGGLGKKKKKNGC